MVATLFWILLLYAILRVSPGLDILTVTAPFFALLGSYFALRSVFISRIESRSKSNYFHGVKWDNMPIHERLIFRAFGIDKNTAHVFFISEVDLTSSEKDLKDNLFSYKEPFLALFLYILAFITVYLDLIF